MAEILGDKSITMPSTVCWRLSSDFGKVLAKDKVTNHQTPDDKTRPIFRLFRVIEINPKYFDGRQKRACYQLSSHRIIHENHPLFEHQFPNAKLRFFNFSSKAVKQFKLSMMISVQRNDDTFLAVGGEGVNKNARVCSQEEINSIILIDKQN